MKQIKRFIKKNIKLVIGLIIGIIISGGSVYAATILYAGNQVGFSNTNAGLKKNGVSVDNVQDALDVLYENINSVPTSVFNLGDYFTLVPDVATFTVRTGATGYDSDQTINIAGTDNTNGLRLWRVIDIHKDGSVDAVSEYVSQDLVYFKGATGYQYFVSTLQLIASQYAKAGYTIGTRMMGYGGQTPVIQTKSSTCTDTTCQTTTTYAFDGSTTAAPTSTSTPSPTTIDANNLPQEYLGGVGGDTLYLKDYQLVSNVYKTDTTTYGSTGLKAYDVSSQSSAKAYWLAYRIFRFFGAPGFYLGGRGVSTSGGLYDSYFRGFLNSWLDFSRGSSFRPILTLKSGITVSGGSGTKADPYTLS